MIISPNEPRDYQELLDNYQNHNDINIINLIDKSFYIDSNPKIDDKNSYYIFKAIVTLNILEYRQLINSDIDNRILFLYKILVYDYIDLLNARSTFYGLQFFSVARSLCEHSHIFLYCLCDEDFLNYFYSEYSQDEKKQRFYAKRETNIINKLKKIAEEAIAKNNNSDFYAESLLNNLTTELQSELSDKLGELSHLSEISFAKKIFPFENKELFPCQTTNVLDCTLDKIIEYLSATTLATILLFIAENIQQSDSILQLFNFLKYIDEELYKFRNVDKVLTSLRQKASDIYTNT